MEHGTNLPGSGPMRNPRLFASDQLVRWCPGCGDYAVLASVQKVLAGMDIPREKYVFISGIGCSSRFPYYMNTYGFHGIHGRALPIATGVKCANPDLQVWVATGDGDALSIGGNHFVHALRRNVDLKVLLFNNRIYGLTKGQCSPTSRTEMQTTTTPYGGVEEPLDPIMYMLTYGATFVGQAFAGNAKLGAQLIKEGMEHKGFAFINLLSQCPSFNDLDTAVSFRNACDQVDPAHDISDRNAAMQVVYKAKQEGRIPTGLLYKSERPALHERMAELVKRVGGHKDYDLKKIIDLARP